MALPGSENRGSCFWCLKAVKWIPVLFISTIVGWSYYAYVIQLCLVTVESTIEKILYLIFYHLFFVMFCWCYAQTIFTNIGRVPGSFKIPEADFEAIIQNNTSLENQNRILDNCAKNLPVRNVTVTGSIRFCEKCRTIKPDRTHHCSVCGECVLKMDHHCPWINNCVCFTNYKYFVLFLGYALLYCIYICLTSVRYFIAFWKGDLQGMGRFNILFLFFVAIMFGVSLMSLFGYHCYLVLENRTTLEAFRPPSFRGIGPDKYGFHLGRFRNFKEVFGDHPKTWFLPIKTSLGDGVSFPQMHLNEDQEGLLHERSCEEEEMWYP